MTCCRYKTSGDVAAEDGAGDGGGVDFGFVVGCWVGASGVTTGKLLTWFVDGPTFWFDLHPKPNNGSVSRMIQPNEGVRDILSIV